MITRESDNRTMSNVLFIIFLIKFGRDLYHSIKLFGFKEDALINVLFIVFIVFGFILDYICYKKGGKTPMKIIMIATFILISSIILINIL